MSARSMSGLVLVFLLAIVPLWAQSPSGGRPANSPSNRSKGSDKSEVEAIRRAALEFEAAFNAGNAPAVAAHWTEDGEYIDETGQLFSGRPAIEKQYATYFAANKAVRLQIAIDSLRLLSDSAAIEEGRSILAPAPTGAPTISKYSAVHVKVDGKWLIATVRDTCVEIPSTYHKIADLEWLIGVWTAEEHGAKTESTCRWVANKSFVQRTYIVTHHDQTTTSGIQLIGFNPQDGHIQSWNFSSDGSIAVGVWSPRENGWSAEIHGNLGDGQPTTSTNLLTRLDDNAYTWQSVDRTVGGESLPDTDEVVLKRQPN